MAPPDWASGILGAMTRAGGRNGGGSLVHTPLLTFPPCHIEHDGPHAQERPRGSRWSFATL